MMKKLQLLLLTLIAAMPLSGLAQQTARADVDGDGKVSIDDLTALIDMLLKGDSQSLNSNDWVDLGLPSGTLWATRNVGANRPEDYGDYFAWGETEPKDVYSEETYKWCEGSYNTLTKYCTLSIYGNNGFVDDKTELDPEDDAACAHYPGGRMPSLEQIQELLDYCTWQWTQLNGVNGNLVAGTNGKTIFLPAAGYLEQSRLYNAGIRGYYDSRMLHPGIPSVIYYFAFDKDLWLWHYGMYRISGHTLRAIRDVQSLHGDVDGDDRVSIDDVTALIDMLLNNDSQSIDTSDWVDLGLPSGTIWATRNVGAERPEDYGDYFAWGETEPKPKETNGYTYKWAKNGYIIKYCTLSSYGYNGFVDNKTELDLEDDAAYAHYPSGRMPSFEQIQELLDYCSHQWVQLNGVNGTLVTGPNGNTMFLPATGTRNSTGSFGRDGIYGNYWSCTLRAWSPYTAHRLGFIPGYWYGDDFNRDTGCTVRAVRAQLQ